MPAKPLDSDYIQKLLGGKRVLTDKPPKAETTPVKFEVDYKPDPLKRVQVGEMQPGDKGDIWAQWVKQHRTGAKELIGRWG